MNAIITLFVFILMLGITLVIMYKTKKFKHIQLFICGIGIIILFPIIIFYMDLFNFPSKMGLTNNVNYYEWLNIIFTYSVSILSALIGAYMTIRSVKLSISEQEKVRKEDEKKKALPLLKISEGLYDYRHKYIQFNCFITNESNKRVRKDIEDTANITIRLINVGMRELYDLYICNIQSDVFKEDSLNYIVCPIIYKDDDVCINFYFYEMGNYDNDKTCDKYHTKISFMRFDCYFKDCYNNWYYQKFKIGLMYNLDKNIPENKKALNISINNTEIDSPPIEVLECDLPWNNGGRICYYD